MISHGLTNKEIASQLNLSEQTVKNHIHRMLRKLGAADRVGSGRALPPACPEQSHDQCRIWHWYFCRYLSVPAEADAVAVFRRTFLVLAYLESLGLI